LPELGHDEGGVFAADVKIEAKVWRSLCAVTPPEARPHRGAHAGRFTSPA